MSALRETGKHDRNGNDRGINRDNDLRVNRGSDRASQWGRLLFTIVIGLAGFVFEFLVELPFRFVIWLHPSWRGKLGKRPHPDPNSDL